MTGVLYRLAGVCVRRRFVVLAIWLVVTIALVAVSHRLGDNTNDNLSLPGTDSQHATNVLKHSFPDQANGTSPIVLHATTGKLTDQNNANAVNQASADLSKNKDVAAVVNPLTPQGASALSKDQATGYLATLQKDVAATSGVAGVSPMQLDKAATTAYFNAISKAGPAEKQTTDLVSKLRATTIPSAEKSTNMRAYVGGSTAGYVDLASRISAKLPLQIAVVITLSFLLLILAFRTVVVPPQAAVMNLLSIGASYGVLTAVFQYGWLSGGIGLSGSVPIVSYVPLFMFAILFGLSMDYEVFLVSQIEEHVQAGEDNTSSVVSGLVTSGRVITAAALIMVFVFGSFLLNGDPTIKQFGIGLAVAVILDATVVRCLLVPALMVVMGEHNWFMPRWLDRVTPRISIEGAEFFAERDRIPDRGPEPIFTPSSGHR
jgi:uncharacterized membrane protein YdfJ with MMPL/SSD domain